MAIYNIHAGHCPQGKGAFGAVGILKESVEDRLVKDEVIRLLRLNGHTVYDCTCEENTSKNGCLNKIVWKCNQNKVDLDISIHLNSGRNDYHGDKSTGGTEVICYDYATKDVAKRIANHIANEFGYRLRKDNTTPNGCDGVKINKTLYVLNSTLSPAILIECCFVDDVDDAKVWDAKKCAKAIVEGVLNKKITTDGHWEQNTTGWWWVNEDGTYPINSWKQIGGKWYYFGEKGYMHTGWKKLGDKWYWMDGSGAMVTGWKFIVDAWYYFNNSGAMLENQWLTLYGKTYWLKSSGRMARNEIFTIDGKQYAFLADGHMAISNENGELL